ncbi:MAG TPA: tripartite tricarboxylate transporter substrate binding protein [Burkholderiales bacterium]
MLFKLAKILVLAALPLGVHAQSFPSKPVHIIVPFTPGSATDIMARSVSDKLSAALGQPVLVENRPGAGGTIGTAVVAKATPDGHTLVVVSAGHAINPVIYPNLPYDSAKDLSAVIPLGTLPSILIVPPALGVKSVAELVALAKAKPGALNFTSAGIGSASHASAEKFAAATGIQAVHVPVKGAPEIVTETMTGRAQFALVGIVSAVSAINDGRLLGLAVSSPNRSPALPNVPTLAEAGLPQAEFNFWIGMLAPSQTPRTVIQRLHDEIEKIVQLPDVKGRLAKLGAEPMPMTPEQFDALIRNDFATLGPLMRAAGVKGN